MLDDLVATIETLKARIQNHRADLQANETRTRVALIDPLLTVLGWDTSDPGLVTLEYQVGDGRADYALLKPDGGPAATVEAKKLGEAFGSHLMQMLNYSNAAGVEYAGLTDGNRWEMYEVFKRGQLEDRRVLEVTIADSQPHECALKLLLLWRPNLASGQPVAAQAPMITPNVAPVQTSDTIEQLAIIAQPPVDPREEGWTSLSELQSVTGRLAPSAIRLPDGREKPTNYWWEVLFGIAEWQVTTGKLTPDICPIWNGRTRYIVHTAPQHSNGTSFNQPPNYRTVSLLILHTIR